MKSKPRGVLIRGHRTFRISDSWVYQSGVHARPVIGEPQVPRWLLWRMPTNSVYRECHVTAHSSVQGSGVGKSENQEITI